MIYFCFDFYKSIILYFFFFFFFDSVIAQVPYILE
jgi:hypothetical protein